MSSVSNYFFEKNVFYTHSLGCRLCFGGGRYIFTDENVWSWI